MVRLAIRDSAHHFISRSSQGAGLCCECVFLHLIKEPGFVTHRILRSKSNTYYMNTTAGYFPTSPDIFVYKQQKKKKKKKYRSPQSAQMLFGLSCYWMNAEFACPMGLHIRLSFILFLFSFFYPFFFSVIIRSHWSLSLCLVIVTVCSGCLSVCFSSCITCVSLKA